MAVSIKVNGVANSLVHKGSGGVSMATMPDVCKTPSPGGPVPLPYPNVSQSASLTKGTTTVKADGGHMIAVKGSEFSASNGDNAGVLGGAKSGTFMKESTWISYSFDVKIQGRNACRLTDKKIQNHGNTADLAGLLQQPAEVQATDADHEKCPCCGLAAHGNQKDADGNVLKPMKRDDYYRKKKAEVDKKSAGYPEWAEKNPSRTEESMTLKFGSDLYGPFSGKPSAIAAEEARRAEQMLDELLGLMENNKNCPNVQPDSGCGTHFDLPAGQIVSNQRKEFNNKHRKGFIKHWDQENPDNEIPTNTSINHITPLNAGGCPSGGGETKGFPGLVPNHILSGPCADIEKRQTALQGRET